MKSSPLHTLYSTMNGLETRLGGGEGVVGCYGSITEQGLDKIFKVMEEHTGLDKDSVLVDIGAGLGKPLMHAAFAYGLPDSFGIEIDQVKVDKSVAFLEQTIVSMRRKGFDMAHVNKPRMTTASIETTASLEPATHLYSFWEGIPYEAREAVGRLVCASRTIRGIAVVQRAIRGQSAESEMEDLFFGPGMRLVDSFSVKMSGSGKAFTCYVFSRDSPIMLPRRAPAAAAAQVLGMLHTRALPTSEMGKEEEDEPEPVDKERRSSPDRADSSGRAGAKRSRTQVEHEEEAEEDKAKLVTPPLDRVQPSRQLKQARLSLAGTKQLAMEAVEGHKGKGLAERRVVARGLGLGTNVAGLGLGHGH